MLAGVVRTYSLLESHCLAGYADAGDAELSHRRGALSGGGTHL